MKAKLGVLLTLLLVAATALKAWPGNDNPKGERQAMIYTFALKSIDGQEVNLSQYRGKTLLLVNVASQCGYTPQYEGLEALYKRYQKRGLVVIGFPANDFGGQEPGSNQEVAEFCRLNFGVSFPMFEKSNVKEEPLNPVFEKLNASLGAPTWNFNKYLLDRRGHPVKHFDVSVEPDAPQLTAAIDEQLRD